MSAATACVIILLEKAKNVLDHLWKYSLCLCFETKKQKKDLFDVGCGSKLCNSTPRPRSPAHPRRLHSRRLHSRRPRRRPLTSSTNPLLHNHQTRYPNSTYHYLPLSTISGSTPASSMATLAAAPFLGRTLSLRSLLVGLPVLPALAIPASIQLSLPSFLPGLWDSVLRAVPKKKQSHSRKRMRQMAGKALKDVTALNRCSACGRVKRTHVLCEHCVKGIKEMWLGKGRMGGEGPVAPA